MPGRRASLFAQLPLLLLCPLLSTTARSLNTSSSAPPQLIFRSHLENPALTFNASAQVPSAYNAPYFERKYTTGWFTSPVILNTHVESSAMLQLITQRKRTHYPAYITAHCVETPTPVVLFNVLWVPNADNWQWSLVLNADGAALQQELDRATSLSQKPQQIDSYAFINHGTVYYAAILLAEQKWPEGTQFSAVFGVPKDATYCCGPSSRWSSLQRDGFKPLSVSVTQDPVTKGLYVADVWQSRDVAFWQSDTDKTSGELQPLLASLSPPLVPVYLKSYRYTYPNGAFQMYHSYIAESRPAVTTFAATVDISRSGFQLLAKILKAPPLFVTSFYFEGEKDPQDPSSGEMYVAVWQDIPTTRKTLGSSKLLAAGSTSLMFLHGLNHSRAFST